MILPGFFIFSGFSKLVTKEKFDKIEFNEQDKAVVMLSMK